MDALCAQSAMKVVFPNPAGATTKVKARFHPLVDLFREAKSFRPILSGRRNGYFGVQEWEHEAIILPQNNVPKVVEPSGRSTSGNHLPEFGRGSFERKLNGIGLHPRLEVDAIPVTADGGTKAHFDLPSLRVEDHRTQGAEELVVVVTCQSARILIRKQGFDRLPDPRAAFRRDGTGWRRSEFGCAP